MKSFGIFQPSDANLVKRVLRHQPQAFELLVLKRIDGESGGDLWCKPEPNGQFHAASIPPGTYQVELQRYQWKPKPQFIRMGEPPGEVVIRAGETATFNTRAP